jgi:hypothetical protein
VFDVREVLRLFVRGESQRGIERLGGVDRKTVRRYVTAAVDLGVEDGREDCYDDLSFHQGCAGRVPPAPRSGPQRAVRTFFD